MDPIKPGDVVQLRSGGPLMTVVVLTPVPEEHSGYIRVTCYWFDVSLQRQEADFNLVALKLAP